MSDAHDAMRRAMIARGVDPDEVAAKAAALPAVEPEAVAAAAAEQIAEQIPMELGLACSECQGEQRVWNDRAGRYLPCPVCRAPYVGEPEAVTVAREEAIKRADQPPSSDWKFHAHEVITATARRLPYFTSEDVWESGLQTPDAGSPDGDALGPAMRRARVAGIIEPTDRTDASTKRAQRHNNPKRVWRSLIYRG